MNDSKRIEKSELIDQSRRGFVTTVAYVAPAILTLAATPALATAGSVQTRQWYQVP